MSEHRSRLNACNTTAGWELDFYRVDRAKGPFLPRHLWRKSSQVGILWRIQPMSLGSVLIVGLHYLICAQGLAGGQVLPQR